MHISCNDLASGVFPPKLKLCCQVFSTILECEPDGKLAIGRAICEYLDTIPADSVVLMKKHRSIVAKVFQGSVTAYCAAQSHVTVIIVAP